MQDAGVRGGWASRAREAPCTILQRSRDKPHWAQQPAGGHTRGGHVWFGVWFPLLCLANSPERRLTALGTEDFGKTR